MVSAAGWNQPDWSFINNAGFFLIAVMNKTNKNRERMQPWEDPVKDKSELERNEKNNNVLFN